MLKLHIVFAIDEHYRCSNGIFQTHPQPKVVHYGLKGERFDEALCILFFKKNIFCCVEKER